MRATASVPPPAPQGHTSVTGRDGYFAWAMAGMAIKPAALAAAP